MTGLDIVPGRRRRARTISMVAAMVLVAGAGIGVWYAATSPPRTDSGAGPTIPIRLATVTRGTVTERLQVAGLLGFDGSFPVVNQLAPGILTAATPQGATVSRGGALYTVGNRSVRLLYGTTPAYRGFAPGMSDGPDVRELEANLVALGIDSGRPITVDNHLSAATVAAIRRWQAAEGRPEWQRTGALEVGEVIFLPGPVRVSQILPTLGARVGPDVPVLAATGTNRVVTAQMTTGRQALVHVGDQVLVTLTGTAPVTGTVARIGRVATAPPGPAGGPPPGPATVPVTISVKLPAGTGDLDQAPAQVAITSARHTGVLLVPVTALLARPGGGYQVRLADHQLIQVQPGLFDDSVGLVEVAGTGLNPGQQVEVPAS